MSITFQEFSSTNIARCISPSAFNHAIEDWSLSDWFTAMAGEVGEVGNVIKKLNRYRDGLGHQNKETEAELRAQLADEIGDVLAYLDLLAFAAGFHLEGCGVSKFNAVSERLGCEIRMPSDE